MEGRDFIMWFFAALMVLAPLGTGAARRTYDGTAPIAAPAATTPTPPATTK